MDLWIESCERFYNTFKNDFVKRTDAVNELIARCDKVHFMNEFLEECRFISTDKYLEVVDRYEKVLDGLDEVLHLYGGREQMTDEELKDRIIRAKDLINRLLLTLVLSNTPYERYEEIQKDAEQFLKEADE